MDLLLQQFSLLPHDVRERIGSANVVQQLEDIEQEYGAEHLASVVMRMAIEELSSDELSIALEERGIPQRAISTVAEKLSVIVAPAVQSSDTSYEQSSEFQELTKQYQEFLASADTQFVLTQQAEFEQRKPGDSVLKSHLYDAINRKQHREFLAVITYLFSTGRLKELFKTDERYIAFWRPRILKHGGFKAIRIFDENPAHPEMLGQFIKYILEHRLGMDKNISALWGVYFSGLAHQVGTIQYENLAHGDMAEKVFKWNFE